MKQQRWGKLRKRSSLNFTAFFIRRYCVYSWWISKYEFQPINVKIGDFRKSSCEPTVTQWDSKRENCTHKFEFLKKPLNKVLASPVFDHNSDGQGQGCFTYILSSVEMQQHDEIRKKLLTRLNQSKCVDLPS